jgi:hypothetical protein
VLALLSILLQLEFPKPTGSFAVGRTTFRWLDSSRPEVMTDTTDDFREVIAEVWYPAEKGTGVRAPYVPELSRIAKGLAASGEVTPFEVVGLRFVRSHSLLGAEVASEQASYPVIFLLPGNATNVEFYAGIADELASRGYIVVGINHPHDVAAVALQDSSVATFAPEKWSVEKQANEARVAERVGVRREDVLFVLKQLETLNAGGPFSGRLDLTRLGVMGHSLGGITASEVCKAEQRFLACLNLDGWQRGGPFSTDESAEPPQQPFMLITKETQLHERLLEKFETIRSGGYRVVIYSAGHDSFTDGPLLAPSLLPLRNKADDLLSLIRSYTVAFFDQTLKEQPSGLLEHSSQSEAVSLTVYPST